MEESLLRQWESTFGVKAWKHGIGYYAIKPPYRGKVDCLFFYKNPPINAELLSSVGDLSPYVPDDFELDLGIQLLKKASGVVKVSENASKAKHEGRKKWIRMLVDKIKI
jgi:hypothetical protein